MIVQVYKGRRLVLAAFLLISLGGCAGRVKVGELAGQFDAKELQMRPVAIGGVILGRGVGLDEAALIGEGDQNQDLWFQADTWSDYLFRSFLTQSPEVLVWPWSTVSAQADSAALAVVHEVFARRGIIKPDQLNALGRSIPEVGYLVLARIESNQLTTEQSMRSLIDAQRAKDGRDAHPETGRYIFSMKRTVQVGMEVYDLFLGTLEWRGTVTRDRNELFGNQEIQEEDGGVQAQTTGKSAQNPPFNVKGSSMHESCIDDLLAEICEALVRKLTDADGPPEAEEPKPPRIIEEPGGPY